MRTARISDLRRGHLRAEFVPKLRVGSFHRSDSAGCTIVTIERHSFGSTFGRSFIYARSTRTGLALSGSSCCTESIIVFTPTPPEPPRFGPRLKFWRTTAGRNNVRGPSFQEWDLSLFKTFPIREQMRLEFRAEFFNAFNHPNLLWGPIGALGQVEPVAIEVGTPQFGLPQAARAPRQLQFALKFWF